MRPKTCASGVIGKALVPLLIKAGYTVYGSTRRTDRAALVEWLGAVPVIVDVFDAKRLESELHRIEPAIIIHQLTDQPRDLDPSQMARAVINNARTRSEGTRNLVRGGVSEGETIVPAWPRATRYPSPIDRS